jgi:hypothetical protein
MKKQEVEDCDEEIRQYERQIQIQKILDEDRRKLQDPSGLEHYRQAWYDRITLELEMNQLRLELQKRESEKNRLNSEIQAAYKSHPEHDEKLPDNFREILSALGEERYIDMILEGHDVLRREVLKVKDEKEEKGREGNSEEKGKKGREGNSEGKKEEKKGKTKEEQGEQGEKEEKGKERVETKDKTMVASHKKSRRRTRKRKR